MKLHHESRAKILKLLGFTGFAKEVVKLRMKYINAQKDTENLKVETKFIEAL